MRYQDNWFPILVARYKSIYKWIIGKPFTTTLDAISSPFHLNLKKYNIHNEPVMINADFSEVKRSYKTLYQDYKERKGNILETNVASLVRKLQYMTS